MTLMVAMLQECERREGECLASATTLRNTFQVSCKEMNISVRRDGEEGDGMGGRDGMGRMRREGWEDGLGRGGGRDGEREEGWVE